jgi:redox-sensitive bicupin YhaK (pirin superfamily)
MATRRLRQRIGAMSVSEGAGVTVRRSLGLPALRHLDPFLMLDHFSSDNPDDYIAGFPDHPHRGFVTFTYMIDGHMEHRDSMGNRGDLRAGGAQWMRAGSGVIHSEMPRQTNGLMRGFQLWVNLPGAKKMSPPAYQEIAPNRVPEVLVEDARVRVLGGSALDREGPIRDADTQLLFLDVALPESGCLDLPVDGESTCFVYPFEGSVSIQDIALPTHNLGVLGTGNRVRATALDGPARFILAAARPLDEPVVQHGPFVMSSREEIEQAFRDYRDGTLVRARAEAVDV